MSRLVFAGRLADDFARIEAHLLAHEVGDVQARLTEVVDVLQVLIQHPLIGRKVAFGRRELVIGRGARGYLALYAYDAYDDVVAVAALRAQREERWRRVKATTGDSRRPSEGAPSPRPLWATGRLRDRWPYRPAAARSALALSVRSQVNSGSSRPKCP